MKCPRRSREGDELIIAYVAGTLDPETEDALERHLTSCVSCTEMVAEQRSVWSALDELIPLPVSTNFDARLYQRIAEEARSSWWQRVFRTNWSWRPAMPVAAACAVLAVAFLVNNSGPSVAPQPQIQPKLQIEQVESALDDMDMLKQVGVEAAPAKSTPREQI